MEDKVRVQETSRVKILWPRTGRDWLVLLLLAFLVLGIVGNLLPKGLEEVQVGQVRLKVPKGFEVRDIPGGKALLAPQEGPKDAFQENLTVLVEPLARAMSGAQYAWVVAQRNAQAVQGFQSGPVRFVRVMGGEGVEFSARGLWEGRPLEWVILAFVLGQEGYQITLTAELGKLAAYQAQFQEALSPLAVALGPIPQVPGRAKQEQEGGFPRPIEPGPQALPVPDSGPSQGSAPFLPNNPYPLDTPYPLGPGEIPQENSWSWGGPWPETSSGYDTSQEEFNTWMSEEWSRVLGGNPPEPSYQDEAGNLYWEGPSGLLHEWSPDYPDR